MSPPPLFIEHLSFAEQVTLTIAPAVAGVLSIAGSSCIVYIIAKDWENTIKSVKYRFLLALSIADIINSVSFVFWAPPIPEDTPGVWGAAGNRTTCNVSAYFMQLGCVGAFYNAAISHYYLMFLCHGWTEKQIAQRHERYIHATAILFGLGTATAALFQDLYSPTALGCWIGPEPRLCLARDAIECERGESAVVYAWVYQGIPLFLMLVYIAYTMRQIFTKVREVTLKAERWTMDHAQSTLASIQNTPSYVSAVQSSEDDNLNMSADMSSDDDDETRNNVAGNPTTSAQSQRRRTRRNVKRRANRTKEAAIQAFLYVFAYLITHMWAFVVYHLDQYVDRVPGILMIVQNISWPLQGLLNLFVFLRPRIQVLQRYFPELTYQQAAYVAIFSYNESNPSRSKVPTAVVIHNDQQRRQGMLSYLFSSSGPHSNPPNTSVVHAEESNAETSHSPATQERPDNETPTEGETSSGANAMVAFSEPETTACGHNEWRNYLQSALQMESSTDFKS